MSKTPTLLLTGGEVLLFTKPQVMGILNVTPDSFSDGGKYHTIDAAVDHARQMLDEGADWIDVGGESTRPGAKAVAVEDECARVIPVVERIAKLANARISIDTRNAETARRALDAGAILVNDVSGGTYDPEMLPTLSETRAPCVLMHMRGLPETMNELANYQNVVETVVFELRERVDVALAAGINRERILLDPGIGFAKTPDQSYRLIAGIPQLREMGFPIVIGASRKRLIGWLDGSEPKHRLGGSVAIAALAAWLGAAIVRVHDVRETVQAVNAANTLRDLSEPHPQY